MLAAARGGDHGAFEALVTPHLRPLRSYLHRMSGSPDDVDDLVQDTLLKAFEQLAGFRGDASFKTWLFRIGSNTAIDWLRGRKRWTEDAQDRAKAAAIADLGFARAAGALAASGPQAAFEVREHVSHCFTCIGKTLPPEQQAALLLREVVQLSNDEGAEALGKTTAAFKHLVHGARRTMIAVYERRCALVAKEGACWQCKELAAFFRGPEEAERQAAALALPRDAGEVGFESRLEAVRSVDPETALGRKLEDFLLRHVRRVNGYD